MSTLCVIGGEDTIPYHTMRRKRASESRSESTSIALSTAKTSSLSGVSAKPRQSREAKSHNPPENFPPSHAESSEAVTADHAIDPRPQLSSHDFEKIFNSAYHDFFHFNKISASSEQAISSQDVDIEEFDRLTLRKQHQRYISLLEGRIIFHEVPNAPHGELISHLHDMVARQLDLSVFTGSSDNGTTRSIPPLSLLFIC